MKVKTDHILKDIYGKEVQDSLLHEIAQRKLVKEINGVDGFKDLSDGASNLKINIETIKADHDFPLKLNVVCARALAEEDDDEEISAEKKLIRGQLALKLMQNKAVDLTAKEIVLIEECVSKRWPIIIFTQIAGWVNSKNGKRE